jgi:hypothetical protein
MLMNYMQNFSSTDCILLGFSLTLISYSIYCVCTKTVPLGYKTINLSNSNNVNYLDEVNLTDISSTSQKIDDIIGMLKAAEGSNAYHLSDQALKDKILTILHGMCSEGDDLSEVPSIPQSVFDELIKNNPADRIWYNSLQDWVNNIKGSSPSNISSVYSSELKWLQELKETLISRSSSLSDNSYSLNNLEEIRVSKINQVVNYFKSNDVVVNTYTQDLIESLINSYNYTQLMNPDINYIVYAHFINSCM